MPTKPAQTYGQVRELLVVEIWKTAKKVKGATIRFLVDFVGEVRVYGQCEEV
jgi:hypothetical protein